MIKLIKSTFFREDETKEALIQFLKKADQLSFGSQCETFEKNFARYQNRKQCVFVNSGSSANLALIQSLLNIGKLKAGDTVGFSACTWSTNVMPLIQLGLHPVPIDIELDTLNVSLETLKATQKIYPLAMVFLTNVLGFCDNIDEIEDYCRKKNILLVEDNCESLGSEYKGRKLGNFSLASTISFYVGHHMSTIEGGAICTDNSKLANMLRIVRAHGWDRNLSLSRQKTIRAKYKVNSTFYSRYTFYDLGFNLRTTEMNGFLGNYQLQFIDEIVRKREQNFLHLASTIYMRQDRYLKMKYEHMDVISNFAFPLVCLSSSIRDDLVKKCNGRIEIRPVVGGDITRQPFYRKYISDTQIRQLTGNVRKLDECGMYFGNNPELTKNDIAILLKTFAE